MLKRFVALQVIAGLLVSKITSLAIYPMKYRSQNSVIQVVVDFTDQKTDDFSEYCTQFDFIHGLRCQFCHLNA